MIAGHAIECDWIKPWARFTPRNIAFSDADTGESYSYRDLDDLSWRLAAHLRSHFAVQPGARVAVLATNALEYIPLFFACQRAGAILVPINPRFTAREVAQVLDDCTPDLLIAQCELMNAIDAFPTDMSQWSFDGDASLSSWLNEQLCFARKISQPTIFETDRREAPETSSTKFLGTPESVCMILYTSGTTGAPKGAMLTNSMLFWNSLDTGLRLNLSQNDVAVSFLPFSHTGGWNVLLTPFVHRGARTILMRKFDADRVLELCERERVTILFGIPTTMDMMARSPRFADTDLSSVRFAVVGGEPMSLELIRTWQSKAVPIRQGYGLTEFGPSVFSLAEGDAIRKIGSIGFANFYVETRVVDNEGHLVKTGEVGELLLRGPACMAGYWNNEAATREAIRDGWLSTGDLVSFDHEGYFYVVGRKKDMIKSGGESIYPAEVEQVLSTHPGVREVAVIGVPDEKWGEVGAAYISPKDGQTLDAADLSAFCSGKLARFKIPKHFEFRTELPKAHSGKILKRALR